MEWKLEALSRGGCAPLYVQLSDRLIAFIEKHNLPEGVAIPSESELMSSLKVSRMTVRLALSRVCSAGYAIKSQGKGTFVARPSEREKNGILFTPQETGWHENHDIENRLIEAFWAPPTPRYIEMLHLAEGTRTFKFRRLKLRNGAAIGMETRHFSPFVCNLFTDTDFANRPFIEMLSAYPETAIKRIRCNVKSSPVSEIESNLLEISTDTTLLVLNSVFYNSKEVPVFGGREVYLDGNFEFNYELTL